MPNVEFRFAVRQADSSDIPHLARHRVGMFRDMGQLAPQHERAMEQATISFLRAAMPRGDYLAWMAESQATPSTVIGGAGVHLRAILPRPRGDGGLELGPEAIVLGMYVEPEWRRRGVAEALMRALLATLDARGIKRIVLHASNDGRRLYERLGFTPTNEMRLIPDRF